MKKQKAAVSVFLIIVLFGVVLMGGLFVDATRILLAKRVIRNDLNSAARSALSYYDEHMAEEYGLFGVEGTVGAEAFKHYFLTNIALSQSDGFNLLDMEAGEEDISVTLSQPLNDQAVMIEGMEEYAKYRAPVNTAIGIVEKLKGLFDKGAPAAKAMNAANAGKNAAEQLKEEVSDLSGKARDLISNGVRKQTDEFCNGVKNIMDRSDGRELTDAELGFDKIEAELDKAAEESRKIEEKARDYQKTNEEQCKTLDQIGNSTVSYYDEDSGTWKEASVSTGEKQDLSQGEAQIAGAAPLDKQARDEKAEVDAQIAAARRRLESAKNEIRSLAKKKAELDRELKALYARRDLAEAAASQAKDALRDMEDNRDKERYEFTFSGEPDAGLMALKDTYDARSAELERLIGQNGGRAEIEAKREEVNEASRAIEAYLKGMENPPKNKYSEEIAKTKTEKSDMEDTLKQIKEEIKEKEKERKKLVEQIEKAYDGIAADKSRAGSIQIPGALTDSSKEAASGELYSFVENLTEFVRKVGREARKTDVVGQTADVSDFNILPDMDDLWGLFERVSETASGLVTLVIDPAEAGDAYLITDYVFSTNSFLTSQAGWSKRHFQYGEVEYILNGERAQFTNLRVSLSDIYLVRLSINFVYYFGKTPSPEIVSRIVIALGRSAVRSASDMAQMLFTADSKKSASCPLCPGVDKVRLTYSDHLRLAFMIRAIGESGRATMLTRLRTMMDDTCQVNGWDGPARLYTRLDGDATVKVRLVMLTLPMFEAVLPKDNEILQNGFFLVHEQVSLGY